jgi:hypothetical protein
MLLRAFAFLCLTALPSLAEPICDPARGTALSVVGVASDDTLNMRSGPSASNSLVSRISPGERGVTATGRVAWSKGQCYTTCSGAEGGLNDTGRSIAYSCKSKGQIWYEVRRRNGDTGWASAKFLDLGSGGGGGTVEPPSPPPGPEVEARLKYSCGSAGPLKVVIYKGGKTADVSIGGKTYLVVRKDHLVLRFSYAAGDGARLRGGTELIEWRWPGGNKVTCTGG